MNPWKVDCKTNDIYQVLVKLAGENHWKGTAIPYRNLHRNHHKCNYLVMEHDGTLNGYNLAAQRQHVPCSRSITIEDAIEKLMQGPPKPSCEVFHFAEGKVPVILNSDCSLVIGTTTIGRDTVLDIVNTIKARGV